MEASMEESMLNTWQAQRGEVFNHNTSQKKHSYSSYLPSFPDSESDEVLNHSQQDEEERQTLCGQREGKTHRHIQTMAQPTAKPK